MCIWSVFECVTYTCKNFHSWWETGFWVNESIVEVQGVGGGYVSCRREDKSIIGYFGVRLLGLGLWLVVSHDGWGGPSGVLFRGTEWVLKRGGGGRRSKT